MSGWPKMSSVILVYNLSLFIYYSSKENVIFTYLNIS
jgi:hypothetical protein